MEPKYHEHALRWTNEMADRVLIMANQRRMSVDVWLREAIREKLERDDPAGNEEHHAG